MTNKRIELPAQEGCVRHHLINCSQCREDDRVNALEAENSRLRAAIAAHEQARVVGEPVAWRYETPTGWHATTDAGKAMSVRSHHPIEPLFASPPAPQEAQADLIERFAQAAHWYINASEQEMQEQCDTRESALRRVHAISGELLASGFEFVSAAPVAQPATEQAEAPSHQSGENNAAANNELEGLANEHGADHAIKDAARQLRKVLGISQDFDDWPLDKLITKAVEHIDAAQPAPEPSKPEQAEAPSDDERWSAWVAGMVGCYLGFDVDDKRNTAIAGIIQHRLWGLPGRGTRPTASNAGERLEKLEGCRRALEIIAVGDAQNPQAQAAEELIALGFWRDIPEARAALASKPVAPPAREPIGKLIRGEGGAFRFSFPDSLLALYAMPPGEHDLFSATTPAPAGQKPVEIDGYKGEEQIVWYISELQRVRFLNQWLADAYCNQLRDIYKNDFRATCNSEKEADLRANNKLADVWREGNTGLEQWWKEGREKPEDLRFEVEHDALSQRLIAALPPARAARGDEVNQK